MMVMMAMYAVHCTLQSGHL